MKICLLLQISIAGFGLFCTLPSRADILVTEGNDIRRYSDTGTFLGTFLSRLDVPIGIAASESTGDVFISQAGSGEIRRYDNDGTDLGVVPAGQVDAKPGGLAWVKDRLYVAFGGTKAIGSYGGKGAAEAPRMLTGLPAAAQDVASAEPNNLPGVYFTTSDDATGEGILGYWDGVDGHREKIIHRFAKDSQPRGVIAWKGDVFVALLKAGKVVKVNAKGEAEDWMAPLNQFSSPQYVAENMPIGLAIRDDRLFVSSYGLRDQGGRKVFIYQISDKTPQTSQTINCLSSPQYMAFIPAAKPEGSARMLSLGGSGKPGAPVVRATADAKTGTLPFLSWDSEGGDRAKLNLLRSPVTLVGHAAGEVVQFTGTAEKTGNDGVLIRLAGEGAEITWTVRVKEGSMTMDFTGSGDGLARLERLELALPFDATAAATCPLPSDWTNDGKQAKIILPSLIYAPDLGSLRVSCPQAPSWLGRWEGRREFRSTTITLDLPVPQSGKEIALNFEPWNLPQPKAVTDAGHWNAARRAWLNLLQVSAYRPDGDFAHGIHYPAEPGGVWANNVVSDPVSSFVFKLADHVLLMPELAPGISATSLLRRTVELWMNDAISPEGQVRYVYNAGTPMDGNPAVLIGAWAYVEATGDTDWLKRNIERLEFVSKFTEGRDIDGDGIVESQNSGNRDSHSHGETAWDCISSGHKNAYVNALAYRAWRGMADLESRAGRPEQAARFTKLAERLKEAYLKTFLNPETGWLGWWRSADGELHDIWSDLPTSLAITYGLVTPEQGREMLDKHWASLEKTGFKNFELGIPLNTRPIPPSLMLTGFGGKLEDGSDTFGLWLNGGCTVMNTNIWLAANYTVGRTERADMVLNAMLARQKRGVFSNGGSFQNGIVDAPPGGAEFFDWKGNPCGYEGHLVYTYSWVQSLLLRDPETRAKVFRTLK